RVAERERDVAAREAVVEERARIARELHDAIAHNVSMMVVQAGAERGRLGGRGGSAREGRETVERVRRRSRADEGGRVGRAGAGSLELEIADDGPGGQTPVVSGGHGLAGMRERVALYGGRLDAGRRPSGGFAVRVLLPIR